MVRFYRSEAIVLKKRNYQETDQIITFFTSRFGKVAALAKGIRKLSSKRAPTLDLFNYISVCFYKKDNWLVLTEVKLLNAFARLKKDLKKISYSFQVAELLDKMLAEQQEQILVFRKTLGLFALLEDLWFFRPEYLAVYKKELLEDLGFGFPSQMDLTTIDDYIETLLEKRLYSLDFLT